MKIFSKKIWRRLLVVFLTCVIVFSVGLEVALANKSVINNALNTESYKVVEDESDEEVDTDYFPSDFSSTDEIAEYGKEVCQEVEGEGLVLLKNDNNALPLSAGDNVSCLLQTSVDLNYGSTGSGQIDASKYDDLKTALEEVGLNVNETLWNFYETDSNATSSSYTQGQKLKKGALTYFVNALPWDMYSTEAQESISTTGGTALFVIGRLSGEGSDISTVNSDGYDGSYLSVTEEELEILQEVTALKESGKVDKIVVLLNTALAFETSFLNDDSVDVDACMWIGNTGITGINAVADVLVGNTVPSGKLSDTYVNDNFSSPAMASWILSEDGGFSNDYTDYSALGLNSTQQYYGVYVEGIYVGYRYYETRYEDVVLGTDNVGDFDYSSIVSYPFGYGLSYTEFEYSDYSVTTDSDGDYEVSVKVTNTGDYDGKEAVQVYLQKPYTDYDKENGIGKASVELVGFGKTDVLAKNGGSQTVTVTVEKENFKTYDSNGYETYILEAGDYYLAAGHSSHDALNNILAAKGKTTANGMDDTGDASLAELVGEDIVLDYEAYSVSSETGVEITNRLDFCDMNRYEGRGSNSVTYVSRDDWSGTWPTSAFSFSASDSTMLADLASKSDASEIEEEDGAEMPSYGESNGYTVPMFIPETEDDIIPYEDSMWDSLVDQTTFAEQALLVSNATYGSDAITSINLPATKAQDGPTGGVYSETDVSFPSEGIWASTFNVELIDKVGDALAEDSLDCGRQGMYLPGINLHRTPFGGRAHEYFSEDPYLTGIAVEVEIKAVQAKGVTPFVKHFVFNDEEDERSGICVWLNEQSARELYLKPFEYATAPSRGNSHGVMSSFNRAGCVWTSASDALIGDILRGEFGFDGVVLTDMASGNGALYMTYVDGFMNGTDLFLGSGSSTALDAYASSPTFATKVRESVRRYVFIIANYSAAMNGLSSSSQIVKVSPWWQTLIVTCIVSFSVLSAAALVMMTVSYVKESGTKE